MVKLAMALDGAVHIHIADKRAITRWHDKAPAEREESREEGAQGQRSAESEE